MIIDFPETFAKVGPALVRTGKWSPKDTFITDGLSSTDLTELVGPRRPKACRAPPPARSEARRRKPSTNSTEGAPGPPRNLFDAGVFDNVILCYLGALAAGSTEGEEIAESIVDVTRPPGKKISSKSLPEAIEALEAGEDIDYEGASGPVDWDENGDLSKYIYTVSEFKGGKLDEIETVEVQSERNRPPRAGYLGSRCRAVPPRYSSATFGSSSSSLAGALEAVLAEVEDVAAVRHRQRPARVLLDHHHRHAGLVDLADLVEDRSTKAGARPAEGSSSRSTCGIGHQRPRHRQHLALAAAHRPRRLAAPLAEPGEKLVHVGDPLAGPGAVERAHLEVLLDA